MSEISEICIVVDEKHAEKFHAILEETGLITQIESSFKADGFICGAYFVSMRWWDDDPAVAAMDDFFDALPAGGYGYIRMGYDLGDYETSGCPDAFGINLVQYLRVPWEVNHEPRNNN